MREHSHEKSLVCDPRWFLCKKSFTLCLNQIIRLFIAFLQLSISKYFKGIRSGNNSTECQPCLADLWISNSLPYSFRHRFCWPRDLSMSKRLPWVKYPSKPVQIVVITIKPMMFLFYVRCLIFLIVDPFWMHEQRLCLQWRFTYKGLNLWGNHKMNQITEIYSLLFVIYFSYARNMRGSKVIFCISTHSRTQSKWVARLLLTIGCNVE